MIEPAPSEDVRAEWRNRVVAEYRSAAITHHLTLWLIQIGASPDLIRDGLRITDDELVHAEMAHEVLGAAGGALTAPIDRSTLGNAQSAGGPLELDVARVVTEAFCLGETVAVPLFAALRKGCTVPVAREALDRVLVDEVRHRDFGWTALGWLMTLPLAATLRARIEADLPAMFAQQRRNYGQGGAGCTAADRAWGLMDLDAYAAILEETVRRQYVPRFAAFDIDAAAAWAASA